MSINTITYDYSGTIQFFNVPNNISGGLIFAYCWGGGGGAALQSNKRGGGGGFAFGKISVNPNDQLAIIVGGGGNRGGTSSNTGGWGGDATYGDGYGARGATVAAPGNYGSGGGGRSAIVRVADLKQLITAGGGGGGGSGLSGNQCPGGAGGADIGQNGTTNSGYGFINYGGGDPLHTGGSNHNGNTTYNGLTSAVGNSAFAGGGGGGGYKGGGGGGWHTTQGVSGGGGGSSYGDSEILNYSTEGGLDNVPGGISSPIYNSPVGYAGGGSNGASRIGAGNWDGQHGQVILQYYYDIQTKNYEPISLPCYSPCIPFLKEI